MAGKSLGLGFALLLIAAQAMGPGEGTVSEYVTSDLCMSCHNGLMSSEGEDISFGFSWQTSMMANAARDPYWQASVRREIIDHPMAQAAIESECSRCHMPLANEITRASGASPEVIAHLPVGQSTSSLADMAADGVTCVACHSITADGLGTEESYTGGFQLAVPGTAFGPFETDSGRARVMQSSTGFRPSRADHLAQAEYCATCHTLITHSLSPGGEVIGELPEQVPFLEWKHSSYRDTESCQDCHMPVVTEETPVTSVLPKPHANVNRHVFLGGNAFMQRLLGMYREDLGVAPSARDMGRAADRTEAHLATKAASLTIKGVELVEGVLKAELVVENLAGHKLPTAYPSRRVWVEFEVMDALGRTIFSSGRPVDDGSIEGNDNDERADDFEPHYATISSPDQVQIYETILEGQDGSLTTGLLTATSYRKDNRLLPDGFDPGSAEERIAVRGKAAADGDFSGGRDNVLYVLELEAANPAYVRANLWYQSIGYRWARNLEDYAAMEPQRVLRMYESLARTSAVRLASARAAIEMP